MIHVHFIPLDAGMLEAFSQVDTPAARQAIASNIMEGARAKLITMAGQKLNSTRMDYMQGIQPVEVSDDSVVLTLQGALPNMIEHGWDERNLHDTLFGAGADQSKIYTSEEGHRYRFIPFRHKTPGASNDQGGQRMGMAYAAGGNPLSRSQPHVVVNDAKALGRKVYKAAKKLNANGRLPPGMAPKLRPHHATDIYAGMRKRQQPVSDGKGGVTTQTTYETFRTISEKKKGPHWFHPGIEARNFFQELDSYVDKVAPGAIEAYVKGQLGG